MTDQIHVYQNPPHRLVFGPGSAKTAPDELRALNVRTPLLVCSMRAARSSSVREIARSLRIGAERIFDGVQPHVPLASVQQGFARAGQVMADGLVSFGGGSAVDTAKAIALALAENGEVLAFALKRTADGKVSGRPTTKTKLPIVAIPITVSGAEITPGFGVTDARGRKFIFRDMSLAPRSIISDPELLREVPCETLAASVMNAIAHCFEALYSRAGNPISAIYARESLPLLANGLSGALDSGVTVAPFASLAFGAYLAGVAIFNARTALHHAICHKLAPAAGLSHGVANAIMLPHVLEFNLRAAEQELAAVGEFIGGAARDASPAEKAKAAIGWVRNLAKAAGLPQRLRDVHVEKGILRELARQIAEEPGLTFNPGAELTVADIEGILDAAW